MAKQKFRKELLRLLRTVLKDQKFIKTDASSRIRANFNTNMPHRIISDPKIGTLLNGSYLDGYTSDWNDTTPEKVCQVRLQIQRNLAPLIQNHPELSIRQEIDKSLQFTRKSTELHA